MGTFTYSTELDASVEQAFDYVSTVDKRAEWQESLVKVERITPLPDEEGTRWRETFMIGKKPHVADMRYLKLSRPNLFVEGIDSPMASGTINMNFSKLSERSLLTLEATMRWKGFYKILGPLLDLGFKRAIKKDFADINSNLIAMHGS